MEVGSAEGSAPTTPATTSQHILPSTDTVDNNIKPSSKQRQRTRRACYPCSKRKIKCDRDERVPCSNCAKRPSPELCGFDDDRPRSARPRHSTNTASPTPGSLANDDLKHERTTPQSLLPGSRNAGTGFPSYNGDERRVVLPSDPTRSIARDHKPLHKQSLSIGYSVTPDGIPPNAGSRSSLASHSLHTSGQQLLLPGPSSLASGPSSTPIDELRALLPPAKLVTKFCEIYNSTCCGLYPVDIGLNHVDELAFQYIHQSLGDRLIDHFNAGNWEAYRYEIIRVALLCAGIAAGVQFSDLDDASRRPLLRQYVATTTKLLRMANAQENCSIAAYPVLLMLARIVQDELEPIMSYGMLGSVQRMANMYGITSLAIDRSPEDTRHLRAPDNLMRVRHRQEAFLALILGQSHLLERPQYPDIRGWSKAGYLQCLDILAAMSAYCGTENVDREDLLQHHVDILQAISPLERWALPHLADKSLCRNVHELTEYYTLRIHEYLVNIHYCQIIMAACRRLPGHDEEYFKTGDICRNKARDCVDAYLEMIAFTVIPLRSWVLTITTLRAALILGVLLAESSLTFAEAAADRERLTQLHQGFASPQDDTQADRSRWFKRYRAIFDRLQNICERIAQPDSGQLATNGTTTTTPPEPGTALRYMTRDDRDNIIMPQRMVQHYLAVPSLDEPSLASCLLPQQSLLEV